MAVVNCGPLPESRNSTGLLVSYSSGTTYNSIATYSCVFTHQLVGNNTERVCGSDGQWTGMEPYCEGVVNKQLFVNLQVLCLINTIQILIMSQQYHSLI